MPFVDVLGHRLETAWHGPGPTEAPTLVLLHEGLGCVSAWGSWPTALAERTGLGAFVYSRLGYGRSDPVTLPRPLTYMQNEGTEVLPAVLDAAAVHDAILVGHSDGGSIAIVHAGTPRATPRVRGIALLAPHVFCEDVSVTAIERTRVAYETTDLRARLARHHGENVDGAFWGWNRAWLDPKFREWNIERYLPAIDLPALVVQGRDDPYGTLAQVDAIERGVRGPFTRLVLDGCGHAPHRERPEETTRAVVDFAAMALRRTV